MNKQIPDKEHECPICEEYLTLHRGGTMKNSNTGEFFYVYICEECNQAFALDESDGKIKIIPYDAEMKLIENKCKVCEYTRPQCSKKSNFEKN